MTITRDWFGFDPAVVIRWGSIALNLLVWGAVAFRWVKWWRSGRRLGAEGVVWAQLDRIVWSALLRRMDSLVELLCVARSQGRVGSIPVHARPHYWGAAKAELSLSGSGLTTVLSRHQQAHRPLRKRVVLRSRV
jgi:hypothetical protein